MVRFKDIFLWVWQSPQNVLGRFLAAAYGCRYRYSYRGCLVHVSSRFPGGISLGRHIIVGKDTPMTLAHEYGHCLQSRILGPLYLPVVGLWSGLRAWLQLYRPGRYYDSFPENWADRLGGVRHDRNGGRHLA